MSFAQAPAGTLTGLPVRQQHPGSIHVTASLGGLVMQIECRPGARSADAGAAVPGAAPVFATVAGPPGSPAPPATVKPKDPRLTLRSSKLRADKQGRVAIRLGCADAPCAGTLRLTNTSRKAVSNRVRYTLTAGESKTFRVQLTRAARKALAKRAMRVTLVTAPRSGAPVSSRRTLPRAG